MVWRHGLWPLLAVALLATAASLWVALRAMRALAAAMAFAIVAAGA